MAEEIPAEPKKKETEVKKSLEKLKQTFVPGVKYSLLISAAFNFAFLVVGCLNVHQCPVNNNIPLFLIATGAIGLVSKFISYVRERLSKHVQVLYMESALYSVELIFFCLGTYWVYKEFKPSYNPHDINYCNKTAYLFAFIYISVIFALLIAIVLGFLCFLGCVCCLSRASVTGESQDVEAQQGVIIEATEALTSKADDEQKMSA